VSLIHREIHIGAARPRDIGRNGRIAAASLTFQHTSCCEYLSRMADGSDRFILFKKMADDLKNALIQANIFRRAASGNHEGVVILGADLVE
jgi:hypothetical protein